jgi:transposase
MAEVQGKRKHLSIEEQESIIRAYYLEGASKNSLVKKYQSSFSAVLRVIRNFAASNDKSALLMKNKPVDNHAEEIKALQQEVLDLKKKLYDETMRADFFETMVDVAEDMFDIAIRKKAVTGQSKGCTAKKDMQ